MQNIISKFRSMWCCLTREKDASLHPDNLFLLGQANGKSKTNTVWIRIKSVSRKAPRHRESHTIAQLWFKTQTRTRDHKAMVWLSVAVHTVSGAHFHTICMIRLIGLVWKHFREKFNDFLQLHQPEIKRKNNGTSEAWTQALQACAFEGHINRILSSFFWFHCNFTLIGRNLTVMLWQIHHCLKGFSWHFEI